MSYLTTLTPAENLLLRDGHMVSLRLMLKGTLMDLLMRGVLAYQESEARPSRLERPRRYKYIVPGKLFDTYLALPHENVFLGPYRNGSVRYQLRNLVSIALERTEGRRKYCRSVRLSPRLAPLYTPVLTNVLATGLKNGQGRFARKDLVAEIELMETAILAALVDDRQGAIRMINDLGGNVLLLKRLPDNLLGDLNDDLFADRKQRERGSSGCGGGTGCGGWHHDSFNDGFDSAADAAGFGGAGCGSDGGSGCGGSGCGGCGGCGG